MNLFEKAADWATGNSINYQKEDEVYDGIVKNINEVYDKLEYLIDNPEIVSRYSNESYKSIQDYKNIKMRSLAFAETELERIEIKKELDDLENSLQKLRDMLKNCMLKDKELDTVQKNIVGINHLIYMNAYLKTFQNYLVKDMLRKEWSILELENLRNDIAIRRQILIPYIACINGNRRK